MSKNTGKTWSEGYRLVPNTLKYLAGDPDLKFIVFDTTPDNSEDEELVPCFEEKCADVRCQVKSQNQESTASKEINLVPSKSDVNDSISQCSTLNDDIPLSPSTREDMIQYLNFCISEQLNRENERGGEKTSCSLD